MSYYEDRIKALEARIEEMSMHNRMKAIPIEAKIMERIGELNKENARLKAEVERLTAFTTRTIIPNEVLQTEVERLTRKLEVADNHAQCLEMVINAGTANELRLQAEVERLTKAGDLLAIHYTALSKCVTPNNAKSGSINDWTSVIDWKAAKEGKQP